LIATVERPDGRHRHSLTPGNERKPTLPTLRP
jgi:hypothetical protein